MTAVMWFRRDPALWGPARRMPCRPGGCGADRYRTELAWREFYADVLARHPGSARDYLRPEFARLPYDEPGEQPTAWQKRRTGHPIVDAGRRWLVDGDLASNQHGWQWTAGSGTDAAPYYRVFNPTTQGQRFDPDGD